MEEDIRPGKRLLEERLEKAIDIAQERIDKEAAEDPELRFALSIVEQFIKNKKRVCYGGTAMNALLPPSMKFYSEKDLPDYDFFTPEIERDTEELIATLRRAGFLETASRVGIHEGTKKIMVNYVAVADISEMEKVTYDILFSKSVIVKGIHYTNPDVLRMMMYLEISRPKGEVARWPKVYERLALINKAFPLKRCAKEQRRPKNIPLKIRERLHAYCFENKRVLANVRLEKVYYKSIKAARPVLWESKEGGPVVFYSPDIKKDSVALRTLLGEQEVDIRYFPAKGELVPPRMVLSLYGVEVALLIQETACHAYNTLKTPQGQTVYIASLPTLITLYLSLAIFTDDEKYLFKFSLPCAIERMIAVHTILQSHRKEWQFPVFSLDCHGYQKGFPTLLREKVERIQEEKAGMKVKELLKTRKRKHRRSKTRKL
jgi:Poly(A) polymerase catalytic subunit